MLRLTCRKPILHLAGWGLHCLYKEVKESVVSWVRQDRCSSISVCVWGLCGHLIFSNYFIRCFIMLKCYKTHCLVTKNIFWVKHYHWLPIWWLIHHLAEQKLMIFCSFNHYNSHNWGHNVKIFVDSDRPSGRKIPE